MALAEVSVIEQRYLAVAEPGHLPTIGLPQRREIAVRRRIVGLWRAPASVPTAGMLRRRVASAMPRLPDLGSRRSRPERHQRADAVAHGHTTGFGRRRQVVESRLVQR